jgi:NTE family protein
MLMETEITKDKPRQVSRPGRSSFDCIALLLQGGGALGAYQAGVYEALAEAGLHPDWLAGISIGAINAAIIAGNPPERRVERLREFWEGLTTTPWWDVFGVTNGLVAEGTAAHWTANQLSAASALLYGVNGFFKPRVPLPWLQIPGASGATSYFEVAELKQELERLVDFDRINAGTPRLSVGAVNVRTGNFVYFDSQERRIGPEHIMASGALPPGFAAVEVDGERYWDGGLVSNTPLQWVVETGPHRDTLLFQVDLWSARGEFPRTVAEVMTRQKEIQYSSRTRAATDRFKYVKRLRCAIAHLLPQLPPELRESPEARLLSEVADDKSYNIIHLIYRAREYEGHSKDYEFSRSTMEEHWRAGFNDAARTLRHKEVLLPADTREGVFTFDLAVDGRE